MTTKIGSDGVGALFFRQFGTQIHEIADGLIQLLKADGSNVNNETGIIFGSNDASGLRLSWNSSGPRLSLSVASNPNTFAAFQAGGVIFQNVASAVSSGFMIGGTVATTVGAAGGASALPATPLGYLICGTGGVLIKIPYYNN